MKPKNSSVSWGFTFFFFFLFVIVIVSFYFAVFFSSSFAHFFLYLRGCMHNHGNAQALENEFQREASFCFFVEELNGDATFLFLTRKQKLFCIFQFLLNDICTLEHIFLGVN